MDRLPLHSPDLTAQNIEKLAALFPNCVVEAKDDKGQLTRKIDFDQLRQELSDRIVDGPTERYRLDWPGKREALLTANAPIAKTLRPCREESVDFDTTKNLFIEGDNLDALKLLQETYLGKVKMIYIDPPYNTGKDFIYEDNFDEDSGEFLVRSNQVDETGNRMVANTEANGRFHSDWLSMMYSRLKLARNLLTEHGTIYISIDDREHSNLVKLGGEIFGVENYIASIVWEKMYTTKNDSSDISTSHEYIVIYAKNALAKPIGQLARTEEMDARYSNPDNDPRGPWKAIPLYAQGESKNGRYPVVSPLTGKTHFPPPDSHWRYAKDVTEQLLSDGRIYFGADGLGLPNSKKYLSEITSGVKAKSLWRHSEVGSNDSAKRELRSLYDNNHAPFDFPKPSRLVERMLSLSTKPNDDSVILDFFSGSATTAHAVMALNAEDGGNRRFIMVQLPETCDEKSEAYKAGYKTIAEIGKERIRRAGKKIKEENATNAPDLDIGFRVLKIDTSNAKDIYYTPDKTSQAELALAVDNIKEDRTPEDLLFQVMLDWGVDLSLPIAREEISGKHVYFVDQNAIAACFETGIDEEFVKELAKRKPLRAVFRDSGFASDAVKINVEQIFKLLSPTTEVKSI